MWKVLVQHELSTNAISVTLMVPDRPWLWLIGASLTALAFVVRIYLTERTKAHLAKLIDFDKFKKAERQIAEARAMLETERREIERQSALLTDLISSNKHVPVDGEAATPLSSIR